MIGHRFDWRCMIAALVCVVLAARAPAALPRLAIVTSDKSLAASVAMLEASASAGQTVQLVERKEIDKALAEQSLALTAAADPATAVATGKALRADLYAVAEAGNGAEGASLVVFDAATGARLCDVATSSKGEALATRFGEAVNVAAEKWNAGQRVGGLRGVCLQTVRNVDLPRAFDSAAQATGKILTRRLTAAPDVVVLERRWLAQVTKERLLTGTAGDLAAATTPIELQLSRRGDDGIEAGIVLIKGDGKREVLPSIPLSTRRPDRIADAVAAAVFDAIHATAARPADAADNRAEALRFVREAVLRWQHKELDEALAAAEAAYALSPTERDAAAARARAILLCGLAVVWEGDFADPYRRWNDLMWRDAHSKTMPTGLTQSLQAVVDSIDALRPLGIDPRATGAWDIGPVTAGLSTARQDLLFRTTEGLIREYLGRLRDRIYPSARSGRAPASLTAEQQKLYDDARRGFRRLRMESERPAARAFATDPRGVASYAAFVDDLLRDARCIWADDGQQWTEDWSALIAEWDALLTKLQSVSATQPAPPGMAIPAVFYPAALTEIVSMHQHDWGGGYYEYGWKMTDADWQRFAAAAARIRDRGDRHSKELGAGLIVFASNKGSMLTEIRTESNRPVDAPPPPARNLKAPRELKAAAAPPPPGPVVGPGTVWPDSRVLIDLEANGVRRDTFDAIGCPVLDPDGKHVYAIVYERHRRPDDWQLKVVRLGVAGEAPSVIGTLKAEKCPAKTEAPVMSELGFAATGAIEDGYYVFSKTGWGIALFPLDGRPPRMVDPVAMKLPETFVQAACVLGDTLYLAVGRPDRSSYLIACGLKDNNVRTLASSRRVASQAAGSPFDDAAPMEVFSLRADSARQRIVFCALAGAWPPTLGGWWAYTPATGAFKQLTSEKLPPNAVMHDQRVWSTADRDHIYYGMQPGKAAALDLTNDSREALPPIPPATGYTGPGGPSDASERCLRPPLVRQGDWTWGCFGRYRPIEVERNGRKTRSSEVQSFDPLRVKSMQWGDWPLYILPTAEDTVVVGDRRALWLLRVPTDRPEAMARLVRPRRPQYAPVDPIGPPPVGGELPWTSVQTVYDVLRGVNVPDPAPLLMLYPQVLGSDVYVLAAPGSGERASGTRLMRFPLAGGAPQVLSGTQISRFANASPLNHAEQATMNFEAAYPAIDSRAYYLAVRNTIYVFPFDGSPVVNVNVRQPGASSISGLAVVGDKLFVGIEQITRPGAGGAPMSVTRLLRYSTTNLSRSSQAETLALPSEPAERGPADPPLEISLMRADPDRNRVLFFLNRHPKSDPTTDGLWACPADGSPVRLSHANVWAKTGQRLGDSAFGWASDVMDDTWLVSSTNGLVSIDVKTLAVTPRWQVEPAGGPRLNGDYDLRPPFATVGETIWDGFLRRVDLNGSRFEAMPPMRPMDLRQYSFELRALRPLPGGRLLLADNCGLWIIQPE